MSRIGRSVAATRGFAIGLLIVSGCAATPSPSTTPTVEPTTAPPSVGEPNQSPSPSPSPSPTPEPTLSLALPPSSDARVVTASVANEIGPAAGSVTVTVTSAAEERIDELVLRWPAELNAMLFLAPFTPSEERIRDGGEPLVQPWTKWVVGPGEQGEPAGTTSLGYGPLLPGATLTIELAATRVTTGPIAFDLQLLSRNDLLTFDDAAPAELRVEVP